MDVFANTHGTRTPGVMTEEDVRLWAGYTREEWKANREAFAHVFNTTRQRGKWRLEDVVDVWKASMMVARRNHERARKAAGSRSRNATGRSEMTSTSSAPSSAPSTRQAQLGADQMLETQPFGLRESEKPSVPEVRAVEGGSAGHSPAASGGTVAVPALLERALRDRYGIPDVAPALIPEWVGDPSFENFAE